MCLTVLFVGFHFVGQLLLCHFAEVVVLLDGFLQHLLLVLPLLGQLLQHFCLVGLARQGPGREGAAGAAPAPQGTRGARAASRSSGCPRSSWGCPPSRRTCASPPHPPAKLTPWHSLHILFNGIGFGFLMLILKELSLKILPFSEWGIAEIQVRLTSIKASPPSRAPGCTPSHIFHHSDNLLPNFSLQIHCCIFWEKIHLFWC